MHSSDGNLTGQDLTKGVQPNESATYEPPRVTMLGDVVALTNGSTSNDTADMKAYYYY